MDYDADFYLIKEEITHDGRHKLILKDKVSGKIVEKDLPKERTILLNHRLYLQSLTYESHRKSTQQNTYDAIVIGSGISGGWAAKELTQKGLRTLVLERGRPVEHVKDYPTTMSSPWEMTHRGRYPLDVLEKSPIQAKSATPSMNIPAIFSLRMPTIRISKPNPSTGYGAIR